MEARPGGEPGSDLPMLVRRIVVDDEMGVEMGGNRGVDVLQEA
jgi:hypothetical protein